MSIDQALEITDWFKSWGCLIRSNLSPVALVLAALIALLLLLSLTARILRIYTTQEVESSDK